MKKKGKPGMIKAVLSSTLAFACLPIIITHAGCSGSDESQTPCADEGESVPTIPATTECCKGLELIPPKSPVVGVRGICTLYCGDGSCDEEIESSYNCPEDCP